jgi:hypothetical protein
MTSTSVIAWILRLRQRRRSRDQCNLHDLARNSGQLPGCVRQSPVAMRYLELLGPLAWDKFQERDLQLGAHMRPVPYAAFAAACLVKLDHQLATMGALRRYLVEHPALVWLLGFPLVRSHGYPWGFDADASLPTQRHLTRLLRTMPNPVLQGLLDSTVALLQAELAQVGICLGESISLDTKHIIAWVEENNHKAYVNDRYNQDKPPKGDPDCRLGCKRRHNQRPSSQEPPPTPSKNPQPGPVSVGEYYWGYASGVVATKVPEWGEFVLAELTQPFDQPDASYFFPLMADVERRLGFRPQYGAFDAAFDAFYVYQYFHEAGGFAAVPFAERGGHKERQFAPEGLPLCPAGLAMPLKYTFTARSSLVEHEAGRYVCPLHSSQAKAEPCPVDHRRWAKGGCVTTMATSVGARLRYQLDRDSQAYKQVYKQRTANERVNSQAVELGIERPKLRNGRAIANLNTLIYVLINLRALQRVRQRRALRDTQDVEA